MGPLPVVFQCCTRVLDTPAHSFWEARSRRLRSLPSMPPRCGPRLVAATEAARETVKPSDSSLVGSRDRACSGTGGAPTEGSGPLPADASPPAFKDWRFPDFDGLAGRLGDPRPCASEPELVVAPRSQQDITWPIFIAEARLDAIAATRGDE